MKSLICAGLVSILATSAFADQSQVPGTAGDKTVIHAAPQQHAKLHKAKTKKHATKHHRKAHRKQATA